MSKKLFLVLVIMFLFFGFKTAQAEVVINEVQLLSTEERFIELYNTSASAVDLTDWYIQRKTATGESFGSLVSKTNFESKTINGNDYFLISKNSLNNSDIVLSSLTLTESNAIQIKNSEGEIVYKIGWGDSNECSGSCPSNPPGGKSLQRKGNNSWVIANPTPGVNNEEDNSSDDNSENSDDEDSNSFSDVEVTEKPETKTTTQKTRAEITARSLAYVGIPFPIEGEAFGSQGQRLFRGKYFWNFGDGDFRETKVTSIEKFSHTYFYPGDYTILLEYYPDFFSDVPEATEKLTIKVIMPEISISSVGNEKDFFVELSNNTNYSADLSNWFLLSSRRSFFIPRNTTLASKAKMIISSRVSGFSIEDKSTLKLMTPQGGVAFDYSIPVERTSPVFPKKATIQQSISITPSPLEETQGEENTASVINSGILENEDEPFTLPIIPIASFLFIGASAGAVYFIRRRSFSPEPGEDFEILDE